MAKKVRYYIYYLLSGRYSQEVFSSGRRVQRNYGCRESVLLYLKGEGFVRIERSYNLFRNKKTGKVIRIERKAV